MNILRQIEQAVWSLRALGVKNEDLRIAYSRLVEKDVIGELRIISGGTILPNPTTIMEIMGVVCNNEFPYNKIVVYSPDSALRPDLIIEIELEKNKNETT